VLQAIRAEVFIKVKCDLAVRTRTEVMTTLLQLTAQALEIVEFAIDDNVDASVFACYGLIAHIKVDYTQSGVTETNSPVCG
jgi:hypothetical protein